MASLVHFATTVERKGGTKKEEERQTSVEIGSIAGVSTESQCRAQAHVG